MAQCSRTIFEREDFLKTPIIDKWREDIRALARLMDVEKEIDRKKIWNGDTTELEAEKAKLEEYIAKAGKP